MRELASQGINGSVSCGGHAIRFQLGLLVRLSADRNQLESGGDSLSIHAGTGQRGKPSVSERRDVRSASHSPCAPLVIFLLLR
jgi:hypothetical protein